MKERYDLLNTRFDLEYILRRWTLLPGNLTIAVLVQCIEERRVEFTIKKFAEIVEEYEIHSWVIVEHASRYSTEREPCTHIEMLFTVTAATEREAYLKYIYEIIHLKLDIRNIHYVIYRHQNHSSETLRRLYITINDMHNNMKDDSAIKKHSISSPDVAEFFWTLTYKDKPTYKQVIKKNWAKTAKEKKVKTKEELMHVPAPPKIEFSTLKEEKVIKYWYNPLFKLMEGNNIISYWNKIYNRFYHLITGNIIYTKYAHIFKKNKK